MIVPMTPTRLCLLTVRYCFVAGLVAFGILYLPAHTRQGGWATYLYWIGAGTLFVALPFGKSLQALAASWRFQTRIRHVLPAGPDSPKLAACALAVKQGQVDHALRLFENMTLKSPLADVAQTRRWLFALAAVRWMAGQRGGRTLALRNHRSPQIHALLFSFGVFRVPLRIQTLSVELKDASSSDLDLLAQDYIKLVDVLINSLGEREAPFAEEAEELLAFMTGKSYMLGARERFTAWWGGIRPVLLRGGGALLAGIRLLQREAYAEAHELLTRLSQDGMLSDETDTIRRIAGFLALFAQSQWRLTSGDIPRYFAQGYYYLAIEMGVLHFPTAELPEVVSCCRRGKILRDSKKRLVEDSLSLWNIFGEELSPHMSLLLKRLLEQKGRHCPTKVSYWRELWDSKATTFERPISLIMDGAAATNTGNLDAATLMFEEAAKLEPGLSLPLVNLVHIRMLSGRIDEAKKLADEIQKRFPKDGHAMISLGRLYAMHLEDTATASKFFEEARIIGDAPTEALICLGEVKLMEGHYIESQEYFKRAKECDPSLPNPKLGLARVYMETKRYDLAIENLQSVVVDGPPEARDMANYLLYRAHRDMGDDRRAVEYLDQVPAHFSFFKEPDVLDEIAVHLEGEKMYAKAREFAERAMLLRVSGKDTRDDPDALSAF